jgi:hypothetical protein
MLPGHPLSVEITPIETQVLLRCTLTIKHYVLPAGPRVGMAYTEFVLGERLQLFSAKPHQTFLFISSQKFIGLSISARKKVQVILLCFKCCQL